MQHIRYLSISISTVLNFLYPKEALAVGTAIGDPAT
jgi:hypothetical protein